MPASEATTTATGTVSGKATPRVLSFAYPSSALPGVPPTANIPGLVYRSQDWLDAWQGSWNWRAAASFVTGAHSLKIGYQGNYLTDDQVWYTNDEQLAYRLNNGVPNQLTQYIAPYQRDSRAAFYGIYAQEQWTSGRLTLQGALRFDHARSWFPEQQEGPSRFLPEAIRFPKTEGRGQLQRSLPASRRRLRSLRQRQDRPQGQRRQVSGGRRHPTQFRQPESHVPASGDGSATHGHPHVDRRQQQLPARLRSARTDGAGSSGQRTRPLWSALEFALWSARLYEHL